MNRMVLLTSTMLTFGCATGTWVHQSKDSSQFQADYHDCEVQAAQVAANWGMRGNVFVMADEIGKCLNLKHGWQKQGANQVAHDQAIERSLHVIEIESKLVRATSASRGSGESNDMAITPTTATDGKLGVELLYSSVPILIQVKISNLAEGPVRILWQDAAFIDESGESQPLIRDGSDFSKKDSARDPTLLAGRASISGSYIPSALIRPRAGKWVLTPSIPKELVGPDGNLQPMATSTVDVDAAVRQRNVGKTVRVFMPIEMDGRVVDYTFEIAFTGTTLRKTTSAEMEHLLTR